MNNMKMCTVFINPNNYRVNGFSFEINIENPPKIPYFYNSGESPDGERYTYVDPIIVVTGYDPDLRYKTYNPETNTFV